jgi:hypothetical protein
VNNELHQKKTPCVLLQAEKTHCVSDTDNFPYAGKRKAAQVILEKNERARQSTGAILVAVILILVFAFQAN